MRHQLRQQAMRGQHPLIQLHLRAVCPLSTCLAELPPPIIV